MNAPLRDITPADSERVRFEMLLHTARSALYEAELMATDRLGGWPLASVHEARRAVDSAMDYTYEQKGAGHV